MTLTNDAITICSGESATVMVDHVTGGVGPYHYSWDNGTYGDDTEFTVNGLVDNATVSLTVMDSNECTGTATASITVNTPSVGTLSLDGEDSVQTQKVREFRTMLENKLRSSGPLSKVRVVWQDERYSTVEAEDVLIQADMSREDRKKIIDRQAAIVILQRYLDRMPRKEGNDE